MAVHDSQMTVAVTGGPSNEVRMTSDRYCRHCSEIALAYDPAVDSARCRSCGKVA